MQLIYDISRLSTRSLNATPNGIDWIDSLLATAFCSERAGRPLLFGLHGPRLFEAGRLKLPTSMHAQAWGWSSPALGDRLPGALVDAVRGRQAKSRVVLRGAPERLAQVVRVARSAWRYGLARGLDPKAAAPRNAVYLNATHYPLEHQAHVGWLDARADIAAAMFVYDLLPLEAPHWFWSGEPERHARRIAFLARRGAGAIVTSEAVAAGLAERLRGTGRSDLAIHLAHPPVLPLFHMHVNSDPRLSDVPYFVACGTIEPRKNHRLLIEIWRRLVGRHGAGAPRLIVVGKRGWKCEAVLSAMHDPTLRSAIIEVNGLTTGAYRILLAGARALLAPSLAEGFGLPLAEARASGVPAIASDIPPHREQGEGNCVLLDPRRVDDWVAAVESCTDPARARPPAPARLDGPRRVDMERYGNEIAAFLSGLPGR